MPSPSYELANDYYDLNIKYGNVERRLEFFVDVHPLNPTKPGRISLLTGTAL